MNSKDKVRIIERYNKRLVQYGNSIEALASGKEERRTIRFDVLLGVGISPGDKVLDLGCGFGDLYPYIQKKFGKGSVQYTGVDINENLISVARKQFPEAEFYVKDILHDDFEEYDFIVSTSCFNLRLNFEDNYLFVSQLLTACYNKARKGVAVDFLTSYVDFRGVEEAFYYEPEKIFKIAKNITKRVTLRHDYPLFEFCVYLYPDFIGWKNQ